MKLQDLETFVVAPPEGAFGGRFFVFVKVTTDDGVMGYGEVYAVPFDPLVVEKMIGDIFQRYFEGMSPFNIETMWRRVYGGGFTQRPDVSVGGILSGLEMACWDIIGKATNQPVYNLLGGRVNERLRTYTYLYPKPEDQSDVYMDADLAAERAAEFVEMGFTAVKFDPVSYYSAFDGRMPSLPELRRAEDFCARIREAVGDRADLLFGTHGQFTAEGAMRMAARLEKYDPLWFEEPLPPDAPAEEFARVANGTSIPIATGERLTTIWEFGRLIEKGGAGILQMNLGRVGGILQAKKIAGMAESHHVLIAPHLYCGPIVGAANIQLSTCSPNFLILEGIRRWDGFHADILKKPIVWEEGYVIPPSEPGLGVELDEEVVLAHPYSGNGLHLEMLDRPARLNEGGQMAHNLSTDNLPDNKN